ncbi:MAG: NAD(P)H-dependent oxidoreductase [Methanobacterium sp.]|nr:NAD(P)H-dependent oxidoreductase [Methanobacterium sp.]
MSPCKACMYCKDSEGECATEDDMQTIYDELKEVTGFILGSPVYVADVCPVKNIHRSLICFL